MKCDWCEWTFPVENHQHYYIVVFGDLKGNIWENILCDEHVRRLTVNRELIKHRVPVPVLRTKIMYMNADDWAVSEDPV